MPQAACIQRSAEKLRHVSRLQRRNSSHVTRGQPLRACRDVFETLPLDEELYVLSKLNLVARGSVSMRQCLAASWRPNAALSSAVYGSRLWQSSGAGLLLSRPSGNDSVDAGKSSSIGSHQTQTKRYLATSITRLRKSGCLHKRPLPNWNTGNFKNVALKQVSHSRHFSVAHRSAFNSGMNPDSSPMHRAYIALGSNVGARVEMIEKACQEMERAHIRVKRTSSLFETAPMYVLDQDPFMNGVCEVETSLGPLELLDTLQSIELALGRKKLIDKGPRSIDLDILLYDQEIFSHERLNIPHKLMLERDFVLRPLCQLIPHELPPLPGQHRSYLSHLQSLPPPEPVPVATTYISPNFPPLRSTDPTRPTHIMAILNITPDSFSDGGKHWSQDPAALTATIRAFIAAGATIIDIGGESTRPGSVPVGEAEELARVIPVIQHIRTAIPEAHHIALSIDTYRAKVAEAACAAGADIINDVSAGTLDPLMLPTMARTGKAVILMHMRGDPSTMTSLTTYPNGVIADVGAELRERVAAAEAAGVRRWRMILDPGLGFAKGQTEDLAILRDLQRLRGGVEGLECLPWLMGPSRKRFIGRLTGVEKASERTWGTAATVTASIAGGADIVRVHDVREMWQVAKVADAIYRVES